MLVAGIYDYISKPIDIDGVLDILLGAGFPERQRDVSTGGCRTARPRHAARARPRWIEQAHWVTGGKATMFRRIAAVFLQHMPTRIQELQLAMINNDQDETNRLAHSIQGAAGSLGGRRVQRIAAEIEMLARDGAMEAIPDCYATLVGEFDASTQALEGLDWAEPFEETTVQAAAAEPEPAARSPATG